MVLGVHIGHDAACALFRGDRLVYAEEEERQCDSKNYFGIPWRSIRASLDFANAPPDDVIAIAIGWRVKDLLASREEASRQAIEMSNMEWGCGKISRAKAISHMIEELRIAFPNARLIEIPHHFAHANSVAPFHPPSDEDIPALIMDAAGEHHATTVYTSYRDPESLILAWPVTSSIGYFYQRWAEILGFRGRQACGYLMALAAYGDSHRYGTVLRNYCLGKSPESLPWISPEAFRYYAGKEGNATRCFPASLIRLFGLDSRPSDPMTKADVAAAVQDVTVDIIKSLVFWIAEKVGNQSLIVSGGVMMNCAAVGELRRSAAVKSILTGPAAKDSGVAVGAGFAVLREHGARNGTLSEEAKPFIGTTLSDAEPDALELRNLGIESTRLCDTVSAIAEDLIQGRIIGVADGRLEFGPRALGGRSILALPSRLDTRLRLNRMKGRFPFQPVASSMLPNAAKQLFDGDSLEHFMSATRVATPNAYEICPAAIHVDGTCRVHVLPADENRLLNSVLRYLASCGIVPALLNTSLNSKGRPLPRTLSHALLEAQRLGLDALFTSTHRYSFSKDMATSEFCHQVPINGEGLKRVIR